MFRNTSILFLFLLASSLCSADDRSGASHLPESVLTCSVVFQNPSNSSEKFTRTHEIFSLGENKMAALVHDGDMFVNYRTTNVRRDLLPKSTIERDSTLKHLAKLSKVNLRDISFVEAYTIDPGPDGSLALIVSFKDGSGQVLGKSGMFGWLAASCSMGK